MILIVGVKFEVYVYEAQCEKDILYSFRRGTP
jgi:hypothetical protein